MNRTGTGLAIVMSAFLIGGCAAAGATANGAPQPDASTIPSSTASPTPGATSTAGAPAPARQAAQRCHTSDLTGHVEGQGAGAGQRYALLGLTNKTSTPCTVYGYPGLQLVGPDGKALPTTVRRNTAVKPKLLRVKPGMTVWAQMQWTVVPADDEAANHCAPDPVALRVIPPDETTQLTMAFRRGAVCQHGSISVDAFGTQRPADG